MKYAGVGVAAAVLVLSVGVIQEARTQQQRSVQPRSAPVTPRASVSSDAKETLVQGTVVTYAEHSTRPPMGAHLTVQTATGAVDVHLGPASYLRANHFSLVTGDSVSVVGKLVQIDKQPVFQARIVQKGNQSITVRTPRGFLMASTAGRSSATARSGQTTQQGGPR